jgi:hypothetical protein
VICKKIDLYNNLEHLHVLYHNVQVVEPIGLNLE